MTRKLKAVRKISLNIRMKIPKNGTCWKYVRKFSQVTVTRKDPTGHCQHCKGVKSFFFCIQKF